MWQTANAPGKALQHVQSEGFCAAKKTTQIGNQPMPRAGAHSTAIFASPWHGRSWSGWGLTEVGEHLSSLDLQRNTGTYQKILKDWIIS